MAGTGTVSMRGRLIGPRVVEHGGPPEDDEYWFKFYGPGSVGESDVNWREICDIDAYPHAAGNTPAGRKPKDLGNRAISFESDSDLIGRYLNGDIVESIASSPEINVEVWTGPERNYGVGPQGTSYPPCLCHW